MGYAWVAAILVLTLAFCKDSYAIRCYQAPTLSLVQRAKAQGFYEQMAHDNPGWARSAETDQTWTSCPAQEHFGHSYWWLGAFSQNDRRQGLLWERKGNILMKTGRANGIVVSASSERDLLYSRFASMDKCTLDCGGLGASSRSMSSTSAENIGKVCPTQDCKECDKHPAGCVRCEDLYSMGVANPFNSPVSYGVIPQEGMTVSHTCDIFGTTISMNPYATFIGPPHSPSLRLLPPRGLEG
jgi:hypothetical protein